MSAPVLDMRGVSKTFRVHGAPPLQAVCDVSLHVDEAECVALVGESGSGKSTLARMALQLVTPDAGDVLLSGVSLARLSRSKLRRARLAMQPVFQDPAAAFNPRRTVRSILQQALGQLEGADTSDGPLADLLDRVELRPGRDYLDRYPHALSGGQRQRLAIARAISTRPAIIIADEPLSGADVSIRAQILNLMSALQRDSRVAYLLVTHDMLVARAFSSRIAVMYRGRIVEEGQTADVLASPRHPYTQALIAAVQSVDNGWEKPVAVRPQEAIDAARGCNFISRCPMRQPVCAELAPPFAHIGSGHRAACHFAAHAN